MQRSEWEVMVDQMLAAPIDQWWLDRCNREISRVKKLLSAKGRKP